MGDEDLIQSKNYSKTVMCVSTTGSALSIDASHFTQKLLLDQEAENICEQRCEMRRERETKYSHINKKMKFIKSKKNQNALRPYDRLTSSDFFRDMFLGDRIPYSKVDRTIERKI